MRLSIAFPNPDKETEVGIQPPGHFSNRRSKGGLCLLRTYQTNPFPFQINTTGRHC